MIVTARAYSNIAFIKYWGNANHEWRIPENPSLSMNLNGLYTDTSVQWHLNGKYHTLWLNGEVAHNDALKRVRLYLDKLSDLYNIDGYAEVKSENNFPIGAGIASSASAFAALALAATKSAGLNLPEKELSTLARLGSGSASRSIPAGFVEWQPGNSHETSFAESIAPADHWNLIDVIAVVSDVHKAVGSTQGHQLASTSDLQGARVQGSVGRLEICKKALLESDFATFADVVEQDSDMMHAVMMTSRPPLFYWQPASIEVMKLVREWRQDGVNVCYTLDAGPNVHCLCLEPDAEIVRTQLEQLDEVKQVLTATPGGAAHVL